MGYYVALKATKRRRMGEKKSMTRFVVGNMFERRADVWTASMRVIARQWRSSRLGRFGLFLACLLFASLLLGSAHAEGVQMEKVAFEGWDNCLKLSNGAIELIATTDVGPRIIRLGFVGGQNLFHVYPETAGKTGGDAWRNYGGHRLWHAPEVSPRTYWPDNTPVKSEWDGKTLKLLPDVETGNGIRKEIEITMDPKENLVKLVHRIINLNQWEIYFLRVR
jgi:hypothetical protein